MTAPEAPQFIAQSDYLRYREARDLPRHLAVARSVAGDFARLPLWAQLEMNYMASIILVAGPGGLSDDHRR